MSSLQELQHRMAQAVMQPLTTKEQMRQRDPAGRSNQREAAEFIRPNDRLSSMERLEIYNRQYWFRLFSSLEEDFPGLRAVIGKKKFQSLMRAYLEACPSTSFSLRNLGSHLVSWLQENSAWIEPNRELALEMATLEWMHIEVFDGAVWPRLVGDALATIGEESQIVLQPYLRLLEAHYAVDDALIAVRNESGSSNASSNNASTGHVTRRLRAIHKMKRELVHILIHRYEDTVYYRRLSIEDYRLLHALQEGKVLGEAIDLAFEESKIPEGDRPAYLQSAFGYWSAMGWFCMQPAESEKENA